MDGVVVGTGVGDHLVFETSSDSKAYGIILAPREWIDNLNEQSTSSAVSKIFHQAFRAHESDGEFLLKPSIFKENIFSHCNFEMQRSKTTENKSTSPSVSGQGALNEYDVVPCLKLDRWPAAAEDWQLRVTDDSHTIGSSLRHLIVQTVPVLLVPTGNPLSPAAENEWRLSFSFVEIEIFNHLIPKQRQLYGLLKYLFKELFSDVDLLSSYHIKTLMLWKIDRETLEYWEGVHLVEFIVEMFGEMFSAVDRGYIPHLFINECNIFPLHKVTQMKKDKYKEIVQNGLLEVVLHAINKTLLHDLELDSAVTDWFEEASLKLQELSAQEVKESYVSGYLTRLLSVSWYCLQEAALRGTLHRPIKQLVDLLERYKDDVNIQRLMPMLDVLIPSMIDNKQEVSYFTHSDKHKTGADDSIPETGATVKNELSEADKLSTLAHRAYVLYLKHEFVELKQVLLRMEPLLSAKDSIGVTVTKLQADVDFPIDYLTAHTVNKLKCNRLYLEPRVVYLHVTIQLALRESILATDEGREELQNLVRRLVKVVGRASDKEPYLGRLSYKHAEIILLQGYEEYFAWRCGEDHGRTIVMPDVVSERSLRKRDSATNFNLR